LYLGGWFLYQFIVGDYGLIHSKSGGSGIAFFAHIGGFIFGVLVAIALLRAGRITMTGRDGTEGGSADRDGDLCLRLGSLFPSFLYSSHSCRFGPAH
jgi:hypothetical protein